MALPAIAAPLIPELVKALTLAGAGAVAVNGAKKMMDENKEGMLGDAPISAPKQKLTSRNEVTKELQREIPSEVLKELSPEKIKELTVGLAYNKLNELVSKKDAKSKKDFKAPKEIQDVIDSGSHLSISSHSDKDGLLTTLSMAGLGSPELRMISSTGKIPSEVLKKLSPELMKDLAAGLGIAQGSRTTSIPVSEKDIGSDYNLVSGKDIAKQIRGSESYANMMADFDPDPHNDDEEEKKDKKDKKKKLDKKVDNASEKFADAMNNKITKNGAEKLADLAREGQRLDVKPNTMKDLINKGGRFSHDWRQAESLLRKAGGDAAKPLIDKLYKGTYTAEEMQQLEEAVANLASVAKDVLMH